MLTSRYVFGLVVYALCFLSGASANAKESLDEGIRLALVADSARAAAAAFERLFAVVPPEKLQELKQHESPSVSLRAAWDEARRPLGDTETRHPVTLAEGRLQRFLGFLEGRLAVAPPQLWQNVLLTAQAYGRTNVFFTLDLKDWPYHEVGSGFRGPTDTSIKRGGNGFDVSVGGRSFRVPAGFLEEKHRDIFAVTGLAEGNRLYLAAHSSVSTPYRLICVDRADDKTLWTANVWAGGGLVNYEGTGIHCVKLLTRGKDLFVFGIADDAIYVEAFDAHDGTNRFRFSTSY